MSSQQPAKGDRPTDHYVIDLESSSAQLADKRTQKDREAAAAVLYPYRSDRREPVGAGARSSQ